jgi:predicted lactoylglutathione lyase
MAQMIFLNLPVTDVTATRTFVEKLGYGINEQFSDDTTVSAVISETIVVMFLERERFQSFHPERPVAEAGGPVEMLLALSAETREDVDRVVDTALANGATATGETQDMGFMYGRAFADPDGHIWEFAWMDMSAMEG